MKKYNVVLTIAGSDSSAGAGIQADIKTISAIGCYATSVITALTAQNTQGVQAVFEIPDDFIKKQLHSIINDINLQAIKIGMLFSKSTIETINKFIIKANINCPIILDPVMISQSGDPLLKTGVINHLQTTLFNKATLLTPNLLETELLLNKKISNRDSMANAAKYLGKRYKTNVLIKGGHSTEKQAADVLYQYQENKLTWFYADRIKTNNNHGTGCTLSSAIAAYMAKGNSLTIAIEQAKNYLTNALIASINYQLGKGNGPVEHFIGRKYDFYSTTEHC